jgi:hypothetical protein
MTMSPTTDRGVAADAGDRRLWLADTDRLHPKVRKTADILGAMEWPKPYRVVFCGTAT